MKELYKTVENMVQETIAGNEKKVFELNMVYESMVPKIYHKPPTPTELAYDNCRQSCLLTFRIPQISKRLLKDAKERFSNIPKPQ